MTSEMKNPRVGVGVIVEKEGKLLLGQRKGAHESLTWAPPGGHLEFGETVEACAMRELLEETGLKVISCRLGPWVENIMDNANKHYLTVFVYVDRFEGDLQLLEPTKCAGWNWFSWNDLPSPLFPSVISLVEKN